MKSLVSIILLFVAGMCNAQIYNQGLQTINFTDPARANRVINTTIYYPAQNNGTGTALPTDNKKYPVVVFGHGFVMPASSYKWLADSLVKFGFIVAFPNSESGFSPNHTEFGKDLAFLCARITSLNDSASSFFFNRVLNKSAVGGHSMGGGCSFLAMNNNTAITALFNFAAAETNPSATTAATSIIKPALIFAGEADCIVAPAVTQAMFTNLAYTCKTFIRILNTLHCQFGSNDATCVTGQVLSGCNTSSLTPAIVQQKTMFVLLPFLQHYLQSDCAAKLSFLNNSFTLSGVLLDQTCNSDPQSPCTATAIKPVLNNRKTVLFYPNPAKQNEVLNINSKKIISYLQLYNASGFLVKERKVNHINTILNLNDLLPGQYTIRFIFKDKIQEVQKFILE